jgi:two-component system OmpR family sensor kinase
MSASDFARERRLLNELSRINNDYATQQRQAIQELARSRQELATARSALGVVAHDLRTPLQAVIGFVEFLLDEDLDPRQRDLAERIARAADQLAGLAEELLDTVSADDPDLRLAPVDVVGLVDEVVSRHRMLGPGRGIEVREQVELPAAVRPRVLGDAGRLERVLENLVGNAIKFSPMGGTVTVGVSAVADEVQVSVLDEGPGIDPDEHDAVFTPFHRSAGAALVPGIGLGLTIVRTLVERHGGRVTLVSEPGAGATFTVHLPRLQD